MKVSGEKVICQDRYGNKVLLYKNQGPGYDIQTDGRVYLSKSLAKELASKLMKLSRGLSDE